MELRDNIWTFIDNDAVWVWIVFDSWLLNNKLMPLWDCLYYATEKVDLIFILCYQKGSEYHELANVTHLARKRHLVPNRSLLVGIVYRAIISQISLFFDAIIYIEVGFVQCVKLLVSSCLVLCCDVRYDVCFVFAPNFFIDGLLFYLYILY
jgi:hypothetical protein